MDADRLEVARRWVSPTLVRFFWEEIRNERHGGWAPANVESAIDSLSQAPPHVLDTWVGPGEGGRGNLIALAMIACIAGGKTELRDLMKEDHGGSEGE